LYPGADKGALEGLFAVQLHDEAGNSAIAAIFDKQTTAVYMVSDNGCYDRKHPAKLRSSLMHRGDDNSVMIDARIDGRHWPSRKGRSIDR